MPYFSDGSPIVPYMSMRTYYIIKDGQEIECKYGDISQIRPRADELKATQIYDAGDFYMTSYGIGSTPKEFLRKDGSKY
jgi:hypothetical protein